MSKNKLSLVFGACLLALLVNPAVAAPITITFDAYVDQFVGDDNPGNGLQVAMIDGYEFTSSADHFHYGRVLPGNPKPNPDGALLSDIHNAIIEVKRPGLQPFNLLSVAAAQVAFTGTPQFTITGYFSGGGSISTTVNLLATFSVANLSGFTGLQRVTFQGAGGGVNQFWIDDVTVQELDTDDDGVVDTADNCTLLFNPIQCDSDGDGYGNHCDGDLNDNGATNAQDYVLFRQQLGQPSIDPTYNEADINCNGVVNSQDYVLFRGLLGSAPGPSGLVP